MKKSLIAGAGVAALGMAVLPFAGVFAEPGTQKTDTISLTVSETCTMTGAAGTAAYGNVNAGATLDEKSTGAMTIKCNAAGGWKLTYEASALESTTAGANDINFGAFATTGGSVWSASVALSGVTDGATAALAYTTSAASGNAVTAAGPTDAAGDGVVVTPSYKGYIASNQGTGAYSGTMVYTFDKN